MQIFKKRKGGGPSRMGKYFLTVYDKRGENLLNESFEASNDEEAKEEGWKRLTEKNYLDYPYRLVTSKAKLLLFQ